MSRKETIMIPFLKPLIMISLLAITIEEVTDFRQNLD